MSGLRRRLRDLPLGLLVFLVACTVNPAGRSVFTGFMSPDEEANIGAKEHPKVIQEFGGEYDDANVRAYVSDIGRKVAAKSEMPNLKWTFTVLNSDVVNAFALPGGYVYVTAGLMTIANNEAELSSVLGHEIGHVTAHHTAERYSSTALAQLGFGVLNVATGGIGQGLLSSGATALLAGFSQDQEAEADTLGVRYIARAGYDPNAMSSMFKNMELDSRLTDLLSGRGNGDQFSLFATHPRTASRIAASAAEAKRQMPPSEALRVGEGDYLAMLDGLSYGGDRTNGFVRDTVFVHPKMRFRFEVPRGFQIFNAPDQVSAMGPAGARILFDAGTKNTGGALDRYVTDVWAPGVPLRNMEKLIINGMEGVTAATRITSQGTALDVQLVAIRPSPQIVYRFIFVSTTKQTASLSEGFRRTSYSFRVLGVEEAAKEEPYRIRLYPVRAGETVETVAKRMPFKDYQVERFRALNGLSAGQKLQPNRLVKIVDG
ncbi:MAG: M48 family metalloprotease [Alphaproteobacteria bacterium]